MNTTLNQLNRRRVSIHRLNREDTQLVAILENLLQSYTSRKDPPLLIPQNQVSEGEGTIYSTKAGLLLLIETFSVLSLMESLWEDESYTGELMLF